jgi:hypothetical protein
VTLRARCGVQVDAALGEYREEVRRVFEGEVAALRESVATAMQSDHDQLTGGFSHGLQVGHITTLIWVHLTPQGS